MYITQRSAGQGPKLQIVAIATVLYTEGKLGLSNSRENIYMREEAEEPKSRPKSHFVVSLKKRESEPAACIYLCTEVKQGTAGLNTNHRNLEEAALSKLARRAWLFHFRHLHRWIGSYIRLHNLTYPCITVNDRA